MVFLKRDKGILEKGGRDKGGKTFGPDQGFSCTKFFKDSDTVRRIETESDTV